MKKSRYFKHRVCNYQNTIDNHLVIKLPSNQNMVQF